MSEGRVLVVDDDPNTRELLRIILRAAGYTVDEAFNAEEAIAMLRRGEYELVTLDIMMPEVDGFECCRRIRQFSRIPIIFVTARDQLYDEIVGLEAGADDFITKPFQRESVVGRVRAVLRRVSIERQAPSEGHLKTFGPLHIDTRSQNVTVFGQVIEFPGKEFDLLLSLCTNIGTLMSKDRLTQLVWEGDVEAESKTLEVHIYRLRKKLDQAGGLGKHLETRRYRGYLLNAGILDVVQPEPISE
ncbi:MAG: response regulator transcription factor [Fimbriimonadaceae bacterium]|nr:response regulator transcription factor [Fimbriimonadaceae bacterium]